MKKRVMVLCSMLMVLGFTISSLASVKDMVVTTPEMGVIEGSVEEIYRPASAVRADFVDYVGNGPEDKGPWYHGVTSVGVVYSNYMNPLYWHGSSAKGSDGLDRSELVPAQDMSYASITTTWINGNRAFWRVDVNKG